MRSYDLSMPEEFNRTIIDHNSDYLFVPTYLQKKNLLKEGIKSKKIFIVGNISQTVLNILRKNYLI